MPRPFFRARLFVLAPLAGILGLLAGCGGPAATGDLDKIKVTISQLEITVTNTSGGPLSDVLAEIEPAGPASNFVARLGTVSNLEDRRIAHSSFSDRDAVSFSMRTTKARRVIVTGTAVDGTTVRVEVPFKL